MRLRTASGGGRCEPRCALGGAPGDRHMSSPLGPIPRSWGGRPEKVSSQPVHVIRVPDHPAEAADVEEQGNQVAQRHPVLAKGSNSGGWSAKAASTDTAQNTSLQRLFLHRWEWQGRGGW